MPDLIQLKGNYFEVIDYLVNKSGAGWDEVNHCPTLPDSVWDALDSSTVSYFTSHVAHGAKRFLASPQNPKAKAASTFRHKSWPLYNLYKAITTKHLAVGTHARTPGQPKPVKAPRSTRADDENELVPTGISDDAEDEDQ